MNAEKQLPNSLRQQLRSVIRNAELSPTPLPDCKAIQLWLLAADYPQWQLDSDEIALLMDKPPYWAFCWASGQVLAQRIINHPELVKNKVLLDFGAGSGVVAIAAKLAGAKQAIICDTDPIAIQACLANAILNDVTLDIHQTPSISAQSDSKCSANLNDHVKPNDKSDLIFDSSLPKADIIAMADVFYDKDNLSLLDDMQQRYQQVWVADSRLKGATLNNMKIIERQQSHTVPNLDESNEFNMVHLYEREFNERID